MPPSADDRLCTGVQGSLDELGRPLVDTTFCVIDLETTGTDRANDRITEIGAVRYRGGERLGTFQTLVNPGCAIPPAITVLTGLTDALVATAPRIESVLPSLLEFIGDDVIVGHNVRFDVGFLDAALERSERPTLGTPQIDTVTLARRLVRSEVPNCRLSTLARAFNLPHQPAHRALDDALATGDLLHLLLERAAGHGVLGLDDLVSFGKIARHPQAAKLRLTNDLPRSPGVYMFRDASDEILYIGKATNLRQRVRSYFGSDDRKKIGPLLRETASLSHVELPDPLTAEVIERRLIARHTPRYNRAGTRPDRYCYVRLDIDAPWPRLSITKTTAPGALHLGPLSSRAQASLVVEAIESVVPLRRCSTRIGRRHRPEPDAAACTSALLGVALCPCAGGVDPEVYAGHTRAVARFLTTGIDGDDRIIGPLTAKMAALAAEQRYEEAASARDRLAALLRAVYRHQIIERLRATGRLRITDGTRLWSIDDARLVDVTIEGQLTGALPVPPPEAPEPGRPLERHQVDEAFLLARFVESAAVDPDRYQIVECTGTWSFPAGVSDRVPTLDTLESVIAVQSAIG